MADFDQILDRCIERLEMGESVADILRDYPQESADLAPLLHMARTVRSVPLPASAAQSKAGMERMLAKVDGQTASTTQTYSPSPSSGWLRTLGDFFAGPVPRIGFAVVFFAVIGLWMMSLRSNPDDKFAEFGELTRAVTVVAETQLPTPTAVQSTQTPLPTLTPPPTQTPFIITQVVTQVVVTEVLVTEAVPPTSVPAVIVPTEVAVVATTEPPTSAPILPTNTAAPTATIPPSATPTETIMPSIEPTELVVPADEPATPSYTPVPPTATLTMTPVATWTPVFTWTPIVPTEIWTPTSAPVAPTETLTPEPTATDAPDSCAIMWFFSPEPDECPTTGVVTTDMSLQQFEHGFMQWIESTDKIYVFLQPPNTLTRLEYVDEFDEGELEIGDDSFNPPTGSPANWEQPRRGFGLVWRTNDALRDNIGFAIQPDEGYVGQFQQSGERLYAQLSDGNLVVHDGASWSFLETDQ